MNESEFAELSAGHSLGALSDADERRYWDALRAHPEWDAIVTADAETAAVLADGPAAVSPPAGARDALLALISVTAQEPRDGLRDPAGDSPTTGGRGESEAGPSTGVPSAATSASVDAAPVEPDPASPAASGDRAKSRRRRMFFALAACLAVLAGLGVTATTILPQLMRPAAVVALDRIESAPDAAERTVELEAGGTATAHWSASLGSAVLLTDGLEQLDESRTYELWFVRGDGAVSAGVFAAGEGETVAQLQGAMEPGDAIAVTVEQSGGSTTGAPTSDPIIVIPTA